MPICFHGALDDVYEQAVDLSQSHLSGEFIPQRTVSFSYFFLIDDRLSSHRAKNREASIAFGDSADRFSWSHSPMLRTTTTHQL